MSRLFVSSKPHSSVEPRPYTDATLRKMKHGKILPMEGSEPGFIARLFRRK